MPASIENDLGKITMSDNSIASLVGLSACECYGVVGMASTKATDGLFELLKRENLARGVRVSTADESVMIDLYIIVEYGISINAVCTSVLDTIKYKVENQMGIPVGNIHVHVQGVRV